MGYLVSSVIWNSPRNLLLTCCGWTSRSTGESDHKVKTPKSVRFSPADDCSFICYGNFTDVLRARACMSITKPCDLALPKFAMSLMQSPCSPSIKRHSMESPLSSPALPSPAIKPFSDFSTEKIPIIKTGITIYKHYFACLPPFTEFWLYCTVICKWHCYILHLI